VATIELGLLGSEGASKAWALNNASPDHYQVVGFSDTDCPCPVPAFERTKGFIWDSNTQQMTELGSTPDLHNSGAFDLNTPAPPDTALIAGEVSPCPTGMTAVCPELVSRAARWDKAAPPPPPAHELVIPPELGFPDGERQARGVNAGDQIVGWAEEEAEPECEARAMFWEGPLADGFVLGEFMPDDQTDEESIALAINGLLLPQVVGFNETADLALLWERTESSWTVVDLNDQIGHCALNDPDPIWVLRQAHDINDDGWIVGWGVRDGQARAFLLTPLEECPTIYCLADIDEDENVGIVDLLEVLGYWGACPTTGPCRADFDCDGMVGIIEFLRVLADWGPCGNPDPGGPPQTVQDCIDRFGTEDPELLEKCICAVEPEECPDP
jgi:hypothetical protein